MPVYPATLIEPGESGSLITRDFQYEYNNFLFGSGTPYQTETVEGILGLPAVRTNDDENQEDHGDHAGVDLLPGRTITVAMNILGTSFDIQDRIDAAIVAFQTSRRDAFMEFPWITQRPGHNKRFVYARARNPTFPSNYDTAKGKARGGVMFFATDPRFYSLQETLTVITAPADSTTAQADVPMLGNMKDGTYPIIEIDGPSTNPRITNANDDGRAIRLDVVVGVDQTLVIDTKRKHVTLQGVDRYEVVRADNQWWSLLPGDNTIVYTRNTNSLPSEMRVRHHDAWVSA